MINLVHMSQLVVVIITNDYGMSRAGIHREVGSLPTMCCICI